MRVFDGIAGLHNAVGTHLGHSEWQTIDQDQINAFAAVTDDYQWIHVDPVRAADGPFGSTVVHGFLTLSLVPTLTRQIYTIEGFPTAVNYGADGFRFPSPVTAGSRVRAGVELVSVTPKSLGYLVGTRVTIEQDSSDKPACVVDMLALVVP